MIRDHATIEELLAVRALGGLDGDDVATLEEALAAHGDCDECRQLRSEFDETAGRLAFALDPLPVDARIVERILSSPHPVDDVTVLPDGRDRTRGRRWQALAGIAAAAVVVAVFVMLGPGRSTGIGDVRFAQTVVHFDGAGELAMAYVPGEAGAAFYGSLADRGPDEVYEIWMIRDGAAVSGGCVTPEGGVLATFVDADVSDAELMAVTVEPASCPSQPSNDPILTAPLPVA